MTRYELKNNLTPELLEISRDYIRKGGSYKKLYEGIKLIDRAPATYVTFYRAAKRELG